LVGPKRRFPEGRESRLDRTRSASVLLGDEVVDATQYHDVVGAGAGRAGANAWRPEGPGASLFIRARPARRACDATGSGPADRCHASVGNRKPQGDIHRSGPR